MQGVSLSHGSSWPAPAMSTAAASTDPSPRGCTDAIARQQQRPQLQSLPIARDSYGRSPFHASLQSPRSVVSMLPLTPSPKPSSPGAAAHLLSMESLAPALPAAKMSALSSDDYQRRSLLSGLYEQQREKVASRTAEQAGRQGISAGATEVLRTCEWKGGQQQLHLALRENSLVACEGSPTARVVSRAFPNCHAAKYSQPEAALSALEGREVQRALLPIESSVHGAVHRTYDLLLRYANVHIVGEIVQRRSNITQPAAQAAAGDGDGDAAEAEEYGRFWVLSRDVPLLPTRSEQAGDVTFKTTVAMVLREGLGALHKVLAAFAFRDIAVSKVESRPWRPQPLFRGLMQQKQKEKEEEEAQLHPCWIRFQYVLFLEFESSTASRAAQNALAHLQEHCSFLRLLGSYPCFPPTLLLSPRRSFQRPAAALAGVGQQALLQQVAAS